MAMDAFIRTIVDDNGDILPGAEVTVKVGSSSGSTATLYQDEDGNNSQSNPVVADADGLCKFYAPSGVYWIQASYNGETITWERVRLFSMDEPGNLGSTNAVPNLYVTKIHYNGTEITASAAEINYLDGVTSAIQTQLDDKYSPSNILDPVSESSGTPTGGIIERGSNANGEYIKFADGTLICKLRATVSYVDASNLEYIWIFPATFAAIPRVFSLIDSTSSTNMPRAKRVAASSVVNSLDTSSLRLLIESDGAFTSGDEAVRSNLLAIGEWF